MFSIQNLSDEELCQITLEQILATEPGDKWKVQDLFPKAQWKHVPLDVRMTVGAFVLASSFDRYKDVIKKLEKNKQNQQMWETIADKDELDSLRRDLQ